MSIRLFDRSFRPRWWGLALATAGCAAGIALGQWQAGRADEKRALAARLAAGLASAPRELPAQAVGPDEYALQRVFARGEFVPRHTIFLDNRIRDGRPGFEVVTPLRLAHSEMHVLVNRGWVVAPVVRSEPPQVRTPAGVQRVEGLALTQLPRAYEPSGYVAQGRVRQNLHLDALRAETGLALQPVVIEQHSASDDGLARSWPRPDAGIEKHEAYALQWYSLAALAVVLFFVLSFRRAPAAR